MQQQRQFVHFLRCRQPVSYTHLDVYKRQVSGTALETPVHLYEGDLIVFPSGLRHLLSSGPDAQRNGDTDPADTAMLCGELEFVTGASNPIFSALPAYFVVRSAESSAGFRQLASMLTETSRDRRWGTQLVQNKLADSLFTMAVCCL